MSTFRKRHYNLIRGCISKGRENHRVAYYADVHTTAIGLPEAIFFGRYTHYSAITGAYDVLVGRENQVESIVPSEAKLRVVLRVICTPALGQFEWLYGVLE